MDELKDLLEGELRDEIRGLTYLEPGSSERSNAIDDLIKLYRLKIDETKNELDCAEKRERRVMEHEQLDDEIANRHIQFEEQVKDRYFRLGIAAAEIIVPMVFYAVWMKRGFKFEETGTYTSTTFRGLFNRFRPTKK